MNNADEPLLGVVPPKTDEPLRTIILRDANQLVNGQRQEDYGTPQENFARIRDFWNTYLSNVFSEDVTLSSRNVSDMMILLKVARLVQSPNEDTYKDLIGYAALSYELSNTENEA